MSEQVNKQMLEAWLKYTLVPIVEGAIRSRLPLRALAGAFASAFVRLATTATMSRDEMHKLLDDCLIAQADRLKDQAPKSSPGSS